MNKLNRKGQSTLEYVVVLMGIIAAIIAGLVYFAGTNRNRGLNNVFNNAGASMDTATGKIATIAN